MTALARQDEEERELSLPRVLGGQETRNVV